MATYQKKRSEVTLLSLVQEAFINGVSTRKVERLARSLGIEGISASQVSEITKGLDERVEEFRTRGLREEYPFLWIDAIYEKVQVERKVESVAVMVAYGVDMEGQREVLAVEPMWEESEDTWREFMKGLKRRGLKRVWMVISDAHRGIQAAHLYNFPEVDKRRIASTNVLERTNREIMRRSRVVGVFPSIKSYLRLVTAYLIECTEDRANENARIKADKLHPLLEQGLAQAGN